MVSLVHHHQIPARRYRLLTTRRVAAEVAHTGQDHLCGEEGIHTRIALLAREATLLVVNPEPKVEAPQQLDEPLVRERLRHEHQYPTSLPHRQQPLDDQTGLDRFSQTHFIRK